MCSTSLLLPTLSAQQSGAVWVLVIKPSAKRWDNYCLSQKQTWASDIHWRPDIFWRSYMWECKCQQISTSTRFESFWWWGANAGVNALETKTLSFLEWSLYSTWCPASCMLYQCSTKVTCECSGQLWCGYTDMAKAKRVKDFNSHSLLPGHQMEKLSK